MKKTFTSAAFIALAMAAAPALSQTIEEQLKDLKRLRDAGLVADLITEDVYQDKQRRALGRR